VLKVPLGTSRSIARSRSSRDARVSFVCEAASEHGVAAADAAVRPVAYGLYELLPAEDGRSR